VASPTRESGILGERSRVSEREKFEIHLKAAKAAFNIFGMVVSVGRRLYGQGLHHDCGVPVSCVVCGASPVEVALESQAEGVDFLTNISRGSWRSS
jgi:hypothetical protein